MTPRELIRWIRRRQAGSRTGRHAVSRSQAGHDLVQSLRSLAQQQESQSLDVSRLLDLVVAEGLDTSGLPPATPPVLSDLRRVTRRLVRKNRHTEALDLLDVLIPAWNPPGSTGLPALAHHAHLSLHGAPAPGLHNAAKAALVGADQHLQAGDLATAAELVTIGAGLLLHRDLHADSLSSPLVVDPASFLAPLRDSAAMVALASPPRDRPTPGEPAAVAAAATDAGALRIVVLKGAYPRFSTPMIEALIRAGHAVTVLDPVTEHPPFRWLGTDPEQVLLRLRTTSQTTGSSPAVDYGVPAEYLRAISDADVVVADWADKGAVWASIAAAPQTRLIVRAHGMDVFSLWPHAINWSRVDALVSVSPHQAAVLDAILAAGAVPAGATSYPSCRVVPNVVVLEEPSQRPVREARTLGLIGWNKRVKDPLWAVEVLARLREKDPDGGWRLRLIGADFAPGGVATSQRYAASFRARIERPDVAGAVDIAGHSDDVGFEARRLGFILSSSIRESFHLGLVEGVLGGAVPVVREWPFFAPYRGASTLFPSEWVVKDVDAAVARIWAQRDEDVRESAAATAREEAVARFSASKIEQQLIEVITRRDRDGVPPAQARTP